MKKTWKLEHYIYTTGSEKVVMEKREPGVWHRVCGANTKEQAALISLAPTMLQFVNEVERELGALDASGNHTLLESSRVTDLLNQAKIIKDELPG